MLTIENLERAKAAHRRFIDKKDGQRSGESWSETLKSSRSTDSRISKEGINASDVESLMAIVEEAKSTPSKQHVNGLTSLICFSKELKEEISDAIEDWMEDVGLSELTPSQALSNIDAYQISPVRRIISFLYVAQLGEESVFEAINTAKRPESIERLMRIHRTSFFAEDSSSDSVVLAQKKIKSILHRQANGIHA